MKESFLFIHTTNPVSLVRFAVEQRGLTPSDLVLCLGSKGSVSSFSNGRRTPGRAHAVGFDLLLDARVPLNAA